MCLGFCEEDAVHGVLGHRWVLSVTPAGPGCSGVADVLPGLDRPHCL